MHTSRTSRPGVATARRAAALVIVAGTVLLPGAQRAGAEARLRQGTQVYGDRQQPCWILENDLTRLTVVPARGGRVVAWIDKRGGGVDVVHVESSPMAAHYGGLLDDHGWVAKVLDRSDLYDMAYACSVAVDTPERVVLETWPEGTDHLRRRLTLRAGQPGIEVEYTLRNAGHEAGGNTLIRAVLWPSSAPVTEGDVYLTPRRDGVHVSDWVGGPGVDIGAPWRAFHSTTSGRTVAVAFADSLYAGPYDWGGSRERPTFEWYYHPVAPGTQVTTRLHAWILHGFDTLVHVDGALAASLEPRREAGQVVVDWRLSSLDPGLRAVRLRTEAWTLDGQRLAAAEDTLTDLAVDEPRRGSTRLAVAGTAGVIRQTVLALSARTASASGPAGTVRADDAGDAAATLARWEVPFEVAAGSYRSIPSFPEPVRVEPIAGWVPARVDEIHPDAAARRRGYLVHLGEGEAAGTPLDSLRLDLGVDEYESIEVRVAALRELGGPVQVRALPLRAVPRRAASATKAVAPRLEVSATEERTVEIWGRTERGWRLTREPAATVDSGATARYWLIADATGAAPGRYETSLRVTPTGGPAVDIPVALQVWPVRLPADRAFVLDVNTPLDQLGLSAEARDQTPVWDWDTTRTAVYAEDLRAHGVRVVRGYGFAEPGGRYQALRLRATGQRLTEALAADPDLLRDAETLPALDLSFWDPWLELWLARGFDRFVSYIIYPVGDEATNLREHTAFARVHGLTPKRASLWLWGQTARYLKEKGFRRAYGGIDDELAADKLEQEWLPAARLARQAGWSPWVTISRELLTHEPLYRQIGPQLDYWPFGGVIPPETVQRVRADYAEAGDMVGTYEGWGTFWRDYAWFRASFWDRALSGTDVFWVQCYLRGYAESIAFDDVPGGPYSSGAWEAVRDGVEDANYLSGALALIAHLPEPTETAYRARLEALAAGVDEGDAATARRAKVGLLQLLLDLRADLPTVAPSLWWHDLPIVEGGVARYVVVGPVAKAATLVGDIGAHSGVKPEIEPDGELPAGDAILLGHPDTSPALRALAAAGADLGVTASYPPLSGYAIVEADAGGHHYIAVIGQGEGLCRGVEIFGRLLSLGADVPRQYYVD